LISHEAGAFQDFAVRLPPNSPSIRPFPPRTTISPLSTFQRVEKQQKRRTTRSTVPRVTPEHGETGRKYFHSPPPMCYPPRLVCLSNLFLPLSAAVLLRGIHRGVGVRTALSLQHDPAPLSFSLAFFGTATESFRVPISPVVLSFPQIRRVGALGT